VAAAPFAARQQGAHAVDGGDRQRRLARDQHDDGRLAVEQAQGVMFSTPISATSLRRMVALLPGDDQPGSTVSVARSGAAGGIDPQALVVVSITPRGRLALTPAKAARTSSVLT
jgi:hypothetical protein